LATTTPGKRRGPRPSTEDPARREARIQCALYRYSHGVTVTKAAELFNVSPRTVQLYVSWALDYHEDHRCDYLRRLVYEGQR
jgi:hypothetical protein